MEIFRSNSQELYICIIYIYTNDIYIYLYILFRNSQCHLSHLNRCLSEAWVWVPWPSAARWLLWRRWKDRTYLRRVSLGVSGCVGRVSSLEDERRKEPRFPSPIFLKENDLNQSSRELWVHVNLPGCTVTGQVKLRLYIKMFTGKYRQNRHLVRVCHYCMEIVSICKWLYTHACIYSYSCAGVSRIIACQEVYPEIDQQSGTPREYNSTATALVRRMRMDRNLWS